MKMSHQDNPLVFNERRGNPHSTGRVATGPKTLLYTGTAKELPLHVYTQVTYKIKVKTKQDIQKPEIPEWDRRKNAAGLKYFGVITLPFKILLLWKNIRQLNTS